MPKQKDKKPEKPSLQDLMSVPVTSIIRIDMVFNGEKTTGWVHTHGMDTYGLPELEIRDVHPIFMMVDAGLTLNHIAQYMVDGLANRGGAKPIKLGQNMGLGQGVFVSFKRSEPINPDDKNENASHFQTERWEVIDVPGALKCVGCDNPSHAHG